MFENIQTTNNIISNKKKNWLNDGWMDRLNKLRPVKNYNLFQKYLQKKRIYK